MPLTFNAIDVETASFLEWSICQVGIAHVVDGSIRDTWETLVDPEDEFDEENIEIHGITPEKVRDAPVIAAIVDELQSRLEGSVVVCHTMFDRNALEGVLIGVGKDIPSIVWLDSAAVARRAWPERYARRGYSLDNVANDLGIEFKHHDALEDARAAAEIILRASEHSGLDIPGWLARVKKPIAPRGSTGSRYPKRVRLDGDPRGALYGETVLFTGRLTIPRPAAADLAAAIGCNVVDGASKKVTMLVDGTQPREGWTRDRHQDEGDSADTDRLSGKHRKVLELIERGSNIQVLSEKEFFQLVSRHLPG